MKHGAIRHLGSILEGGGLDSGVLNFVCVVDSNRKSMANRGTEQTYDYCNSSLYEIQNFLYKENSNS